MRRYVAGVWLLSARVWVLALVVGALAACPGRSDDLICAGEAGVGTIELTGRVVDFESCSTRPGCQGVAKMQVTLFYDRHIVSNVTQENGAFSLKNVPNGVRTYLYVSDVSGQDRYLPTLQGNFVTTVGKSIYTVETYAIARNKALYRSIVKELRTTIGRDGIYIGLALNRGSQNLKPVENASVTIAPTVATLRFYKADLDLEPEATEAFFTTKRKTTGKYGIFVAVTDPVTEDYAVLAFTADKKKNFTPVLAPVGKGFVTVGLHYVTGLSQ